VSRGGGWGGVLAALVSALTRSRSNGRREAPGRATPRLRAEGGHAAPRADRGSGHPRAPYEVSPGRDGDGATRDLSVEEIRALRPSYQPDPDGDPDPGEIVWTWVPYVENDGRGKDRPVLILARIDGRTTAGCYLSTKERPGFVSVGTGAWDAQGRESFLSPERVLRVTDAGMRREGHVLAKDRFARAVEVVARRYGIG